MERRHGNWLPRSIGCQGGGEKRGGGGTDRDGYTLEGGRFRAHGAWLGHHCDMPSAWTRVLHAKMQMSGTRSPHTADIRRRDPHRQARNIQRWTATSRRGHVHVTHKDAGTPHWKRTGRPASSRCTRPRRNVKTSQRPTHATDKVKPQIHRRTRHRQRSTLSPRCHAEMHIHEQRAHTQMGNKEYP